MQSSHPRNVKRVVQQKFEVIACMIALVDRPVARCSRSYHKNICRFAAALDQIVASAAGVSSAVYCA